MAFRRLALLFVQALAVSAVAIEKRAACSSYSKLVLSIARLIANVLCIALLNTRGTSEPQGQSAGFRTMNANIQRQVPGGKIVSDRKHTASEYLHYH